MRAYDDIFKEFQPKIFRYLCHLCSEEEAHDLAQVVFLKVSQGLETFRGDASLATWIYRIALNTARDHARASCAEERGDDVDIDAVPDTGAPGTEQEYVRREMNACIRAVVDALPEQYRSVLILSDFEELTNQEIADILDISLDAVKIRLHRARKKLKEALQCQCDMYHDERNVLSCDRKAAPGPAAKIALPTLLSSRKQ